MSGISDDEIQSVVQRVLRQLMGPPAAPAPASAPSEPAPASAPPSTPSTPRRVVAIGADHGGFELKEILKAELTATGFDVQDVGTNSKDAVDYPDYAHEVAKLVSANKAWRGIIIDGAGIGSCIVANKVPGVRAGLAYDYATAVNGRQHNDTNVLTLGAGLIGVTLAKQIIGIWLATAFGGGRHARRVDKITAIEKLYLK